MYDSHLVISFVGALSCVVLVAYRPVHRGFSLSNSSWGYFVILLFVITVSFPFVLFVIILLRITVYSCRFVSQGRRLALFFVPLRLLILITRTVASLNTVNIVDVERAMNLALNLKCGVCRNYISEAVTVSGCMHSFCESCLLKSIYKDSVCPNKECGRIIEKNGYKKDRTLQMLVYKMNPKTFYSEVNKQNEQSDVKKVLPSDILETCSKICDPDELISFCLEFVPVPSKANFSDDDDYSKKKDSKKKCDMDSQQPCTSKAHSEEPLKKKAKKTNVAEFPTQFRRFFRCPARVPLKTIRRLLEAKLYLVGKYEVHFMSNRTFEVLSDDVTLRTVATESGWLRSRPLRIFFTLASSISDDAPPVLDAEMMPCLMPEAPLQQEAPPPLLSTAQLQPVQLVSPVVPALTVSLSTDIYGHSTPIITSQPATRKRRKLSDPKRSPTDRSPPSVYPPNMLVGPLMTGRSMLITQPSVINGRPTQVHPSSFHHIPSTASNLVIPRTATPQKSSTVSNTIQRPETSGSKQMTPPTLTSVDPPRPIQTVLPQPLKADIRTSPIITVKGNESVSQVIVPYKYCVKTSFTCCWQTFSFIFLL
uniref:RING-type domain-containing protein n=1 Tax=Heterorhabditis bacteriophora TaxID=37862 RepID=A0A1I7XRZ8_HETBA